MGWDDTHPDTGLNNGAYPETAMPRGNNANMIIFVNLFLNQLKVFIRLDEAVLSVEDPEILTAILLETGAYHKKIPGFRPEMFRVINT